MNYFPFHIGDYASHTRHLSWEEDAAYRRLLDVYYTTEKPLPVDLKACCRLVMATTESQREAVATVLAEFFESTSEGWRHGRADVEIEAMRVKQQSQRDKANKRWHKPEQEPGNASAMPRHASNDAAAHKPDAVAMPPTPTPTPTPEIEKPPNPQRGTAGLSKFPPGFEDFWTAYPRKIGKDAAIKAFAKRRFSEEQRRFVIAAIEVQRGWEQWTREGGQFIPHPATWLNEGRWQDEAAAPASSDRFSGRAI